MPLVSVVIPVYNVEKYIRRCLTSIQQQSLSDIEIIVVNDCTPDDSISIVSELAEKDQRIKIIDLERNEGPMIAREKGYMAATGDYITFCDGDDYLPPLALEKLYQAAIFYQADVVSGNMVYQRGEKELLWKSELRYGCSTIGLLKSLLRREFGHNLCSKLFKATLLHNYDYQNFSHFICGEDGYLFYQMIDKMGKVVQIEDVVYYYAYNNESSSKRRHTREALDNICLANTMQIKATKAYPELETDLERCISLSLVDLFYRGYNRDKTLSVLISKYQLNHYCSNRTIWRIYSHKECIKMFAKKYLFRKNDT